MTRARLNSLRSMTQLELINEIVALEILLKYERRASLRARRGYNARLRAKNSEYLALKRKFDSLMALEPDRIALGLSKN